MQQDAQLDELADEHRQWLGQFADQHSQNWEKLYRADYEAAMAEASTRRMLQRHKVRVEPNGESTPDGFAPDFLCTVEENQFIVEVTCVSIATAQQKTGVESEACGFLTISATGMIEAIFNKVKTKAAQCGGLKLPALVAVGTFHYHGARYSVRKPWVNMVLAGKTSMTWNLDTHTGLQVGETYNSTRLEAAAFLRPRGDSGAGIARSSISGLLICDFCALSARAIGVLHPTPARGFDPSLLPGIEFGIVDSNSSNGELDVKWPTATDAS